MGDGLWMVNGRRNGVGFYFPGGRCLVVVGW
jgi:hypothetical protein